MQTTDSLGLCDSDYESLMEKAREVCMQQTASEQLDTVTALQHLSTATSELQTTLQSLDGLQSKGLLSAAACKTTTQGITDKLLSNQKQKSLLEKELASLQDAQELDVKASDLIRKTVTDGCNRARKRRRVTTDRT